MRAGRLRHRIRIRQYSEIASADTLGQKVKTYVDGPIVWGSVEPLTGKELFTAQQVASRVTHKVTIRGRVVLRPRDHLVHDSRTFQVENVMDREERGITLESLCTEAVQ